MEKCEVKFPRSGSCSNLRSRYCILCCRWRHGRRRRYGWRNGWHGIWFWHRIGPRFGHGLWNGFRRKLRYGIRDGSGRRHWHGFGHGLRHGPWHGSGYGTRDGSGYGRTHGSRDDTRFWNDWTWRTPGSHRTSMIPVAAKKAGALTMIAERTGFFHVGFIP